jgi:3-oxoacyl-[acyl-carrier protein] reductase
MDLGISGKVAFVGGAGKGLGYAAAARLALEGAKVALCARNAERLEVAAQQLAQSTGSEVIAVPADLSQPDQIVAAVKSTADRLGSLDILVCNTGGPPVLPVDKLDDEQWLEAFRLLHLSTVRLVRASLPYMYAKGWGRIVSIQSSSVKQPVPGLHLSNGIRPAVAGYFKSMVEEWGQHGVNANLVLPGIYLTDRIREKQSELAERTGRTLEECLEVLARNTALGRLGEADELGNLVAFLASERASYITGAAFQADGGMIKSNV